MPENLNPQFEGQNQVEFINRAFNDPDFVKAVSKEFPDFDFQREGEKAERMFKAYESRDQVREEVEEIWAEQIDKAGMRIGPKESHFIDAYLAKEAITNPDAMLNFLEHSEQARELPIRIKAKEELLGKKGKREAKLEKKMGKLITKEEKIEDKRNTAFRKAEEQRAKDYPKKEGQEEEGTGVFRINMLGSEGAMDWRLAGDRARAAREEKKIEAKYKKKLDKIAGKYINLKREKDDIADFRKEKERMQQELAGLQEELVDSQFGPVKMMEELLRNKLKEEVGKLTGPKANVRNLHEARQKISELAKDQGEEGEEPKLDILGGLEPDVQERLEERIKQKAAEEIGLALGKVKAKSLTLSALEQALNPFFEIGSLDVEFIESLIKEQRDGATDEKRILLGVMLKKFELGEYKMITEN